MSETATFTPSKKPYTGPKNNLTGEVLDTLTTRIRALDKVGVAKWLEEYKWIIPGKDTKNTFEMMALYQQAIYLFPGDQSQTIDGRFGPKTHISLRWIQKTILKFEDAECDGLPGPETTAALITALSRQGTVAPAPASPAKMEPALAALGAEKLLDATEVAIRWYLLKEWYIVTKGVFPGSILAINSAKDLTISVTNWNVVLIPPQRRALSDDEKLHVARVAQLLTTKK